MKTTRQFVPIGIGVSVLAVFFSSALSLAMTDLKAGSSQELALERADAAFLKREDPTEALRSLTEYRELAKSTHDADPRILWRLAMASYFAGLRLETDEARKAAHFSEGREAGLASIRLSPSCAECQFWTAINMALYGQSRGVVSMLFTLGEIRERLLGSAKLDPTYVQGGAYRALGMIERKLPGVLGGSSQRAEDYLKKAIQVAPEEPLNYLFLAQFYAEDANDTKQAKLIIQMGLELNHEDSEKIESREARRDLKQLLVELNAPRAETRGRELASSRSEGARGR